MGFKTGFLGGFKVGSLLVKGGAGFGVYGFSGVPTNGTSGTLAGIANPASLLVDTTNGEVYKNVNTKASPIWEAISRWASAFAKYDFAVDGGAVGLITPATNATIPDNAIIQHVIINSTTAVTSGGAATVSVGTSSGSGAASLLAATGKASFTLDGFVQAIPVPQDVTKFVKMTAAGSITLTVATAALTAGVIEVTAFYTQARA
jgi:hypothetical protein